MVIDLEGSHRKLSEVREKKIVGFGSLKMAQEKQAVLMQQQKGFSVVYANIQMWFLQ